MSGLAAVSLDRPRPYTPTIGEFPECLTDVLDVGRNPNLALPTPDGEASCRRARCRNKNRTLTVALSASLVGMANFSATLAGLFPSLKSSLAASQLQLRNAATFTIPI